MEMRGIISKEEAVRRLKIIPRAVKNRIVRVVQPTKEEFQRKMGEVGQKNEEAVLKKDAAVMTDAEKGLADLLEAAQEMKPLADGATDAVAEEQANATESYDNPEYGKEQTAESNEVWEGKLAKQISEADIPEEAETSSVDEGSEKKRKRGRKGRKGKRNAISEEQGSAEITNQ